MSSLIHILEVYMVNKAGTGLLLVRIYADETLGIHNTWRMSRGM